MMDRLLFVLLCGLGDHDGFEVRAGPDGLFAQALGKGSAEFQGEDKPDMVRRSPGIRPARDGELGGLLRFENAAGAGLRSCRKRKLGLLVTGASESRPSLPAHKGQAIHCWPYDGQAGRSAAWL